MQTNEISLASKAFGEQTDKALIVAYQSHQDALRFLSAALGQPNGIALLQGPGGSGKSTIVREHLVWSSRDVATALVDGIHLTPRQLMQSVLTQFGVDPVPLHDEQMLQALNRFAVQQKCDGRVPLLIVDNVDRASPSTLRLLNWLVSLDAKGGFALRMVLTGKTSLRELFRNDSTRGITRRHPAIYTLNPMSPRESMIYLRTRYIAAGGTNIEREFSLKTCEQLHEASFGWPGRLNDKALQHMDEAIAMRSIEPAPRVIVTNDGKTVAEYELTERKYLIGRGDLADIMIEDSYASKMHAMLHVYSNAIVLHDLNSTNGTTVNSQEIQKTVLRSNDVISLGSHRLKIENAPALGSGVEERIRVTDTMTMQNLIDIRRSRAQHTIAALRHK